MNIIFGILVMCSDKYVSCLLIMTFQPSNPLFTVMNKSKDKVLYVPTLVVEINSSYIYFIFKFSAKAYVSNCIGTLSS